MTTQTISNSKLIESAIEAMGMPETWSRKSALRAYTILCTAGGARNAEVRLLRANLMGALATENEDDFFSAMMVASIG